MASGQGQNKGGKPFWKWAEEKTSIADIPDGIKDAEVQLVRFVVHTMGAPGSENDWTIFLIVSNAASVQLNFRQRSESESDDSMVVAFRSYSVSKSAIRNWDFERVGHPTVRQFLSSITKNKRYLFRFKSAGTGCREWGRRVMGDFQRLQLIQPEDKTSQTLAQILSFEYSKDKPPRSTVIQRAIWLSPVEGFIMLQLEEHRKQGEDVLVAYGEIGSKSPPRIWWFMRPTRGLTSQS